MVSLGGFAQTGVDSKGPVMQVDGSRGQIKVGSTRDGRGVMQIDSQRGSLKLLSPSSSSKHGSDYAGQSASSVFPSPGPVRRQEWSNASLTRGTNGELILSDPNEGRVVMEKGSSGKTRIQTRDGNYTIDNGLLLELSRRKGRDVLLDQLQGK